jgi:type I restriction enzyme, S subunit
MAKDCERIPESAFVKELYDKIPTQFCARRLKYLCKIQFSNVDKASEADEREVSLCNYVDAYNNDHITRAIDFMRATATDEEVRKFGLHGGEVLLTKDSETPDDIGVPSLVAERIEDLVCGYHLAILRPDGETILGEYLLRCFQSTLTASFFEQRANGITRFAIGMDTVCSCPILFPSTSKQREITHFLEDEISRVNSLVQKKQRQIELLQEKRQALIAQAVTRGLDPKVEMVPVAGNWKGESPKHWQVLRAKVVFSEVDERTLTGDEELLTVSHLTGVSKRSEKEVNMFMAKTTEGYKKARKDDLVINTMWAWMGAMGIAKEDGIASPSYNIYRFRDSESWYPPYFDLLVRSLPFVSVVKSLSEGVWTSRLRLYPEAFFSIRLPLPPVSEQRAIVAAVENRTGEVRRLVESMKESIRLLREYRISLITAAVLGQIDLSKLKNGVKENAALQ